MCNRNCSVMLANALLGSSVREFKANSSTSEESIPGRQWASNLKYESFHSPRAVTSTSSCLQRPDPFATAVHEA